MKATSVISPLRYPGGKRLLLPVLGEYLDKMVDGKSHFVDAFVGGGSILLFMAQKYPKLQLFANDKDAWISSLWSVIADGKKLDELFALIDIEPTVEHFYRLNETPTNDEPVQCAYRAIFFNKCCHQGRAVKDENGRITSNPQGGKNQKSEYVIGCRYKPMDIKKKILNCHELLKGRTTIACNDFSNYEILTKTDYPVYLDPPYVKAGSVCYLEHMQAAEHEALAAILQKRNNWLLSYDEHPLIRKLFSGNQVIDLSVRYSIDGRKKNWKNKTELLISSGA